MRKNMNMKKLVWMVLAWVYAWVIFVMTVATIRISSTANQQAMVQAPTHIRDIFNTNLTHNHEMNTSYNASESRIYRMPNVRIGNPKQLYMNLMPVFQCDVTETVVLIFVHSAAQYKSRRSLIRETWGSFDKLHQYSTRTVFMLGTPGNDTLQSEVEQEAELHNDIVQGSFNESYHNLVYKHVMALKWITQTQKCINISSIIKVDDDVYINMNQLDYFLQTKHVNDSRAGKYLYCNIYHEYEHIRNTSSKYMISEDEAPNWIYPDFCQGFSHIMSPDVPGLLYKASTFTRAIWLDDVYVTGYLAREAGIHLRQMWFPFATFTTKSRPHNGIFLLTENMIKQESVWKRLAADHRLLLASRD